MVSENKDLLQFNNTLNEFFSSKPANPYWFLLAMYLRKKGSLSIDGPNRSLTDQIDDDERLRKIVDSFDKVSSDNLGETTFLADIAQSLLSLHSAWFEKNFDDLYIHAVRRIIGMDSSEFYPQPKELTLLVKDLIGSNAKKIYNPFAGMGSFHLAAGVNTEYYGEELDELIAAIADLRVLASDINGCVSCDNSCHDKVFDADVIVSTPPFYSPTDKVTKTHYVDLLTRKCADNDIRGFIVCPLGVNFQKGSLYGMRKHLIQTDSVDMIIMLPNRFFERTVIPSEVLVINKNHDHKGSVRFIDATSACRKEGNLNILNVEDVLETIKSDGENSVTVPIEKIVATDYSFCIEDYRVLGVDKKDVGNLRSLSELISVVKLKKTNSTITGKYFSPTNIEGKTTVMPEDLKLQEVEYGSIVIPEECLVLTTFGRVLKGYYVVTKGEILYGPSYCTYFKVDKSVLPQYLVLQLSQEYARKQMDAITYSCPPLAIGKEIIRKLKVIVPPIEEQKKAVEDYKEEIISKLGLEVAMLREQKFNEFEKNMHLRKHALKQILNEILPASRRIYNYISKQEQPFTKDSIIAERSQSTLEDYAERLYINVEKITSLVSALTDETQFKPAEIVDIPAFIKEYCKSKIADRYEIRHHGYSDNEETLSAFISRASLTTVFDNITANAIKHGFTNPDRKDYAIRIDYRKVDVNRRDMIEICIANNGEKLQTGMTIDKMFVWGVGSGTGLGAWQVKNIVEHYGGAIEFVQYDDKEDGFNIEYNITIPIKQHE